ncbi:MAG: hypothetical protein R3F14_09835 [Polyangiaceae bacterium]
MPMMARAVVLPEWRVWAKAVPPASAKVGANASGVSWFTPGATVGARAAPSTARACSATKRPVAISASRCESAEERGIDAGAAPVAMKPGREERTRAEAGREEGGPPSSWAREAAAGADFRAMPKSRTLIVPSLQRKRLAGLRSRWTTPWTWITSSAAAASRAQARTRRQGTGPRSVSTSARVEPSRSSIATKGWGQ